MGSRGKKYPYNGIEFDSKNELNHYKYLETLEWVNILTTHKTFHLLDGFTYFCLDKMKKRKTRDMIYTPDFILDVGLDKPIAFEVKGYARKDYMIRKKLFLNKYREEYYFIESNSVKQCERIMKQIEVKLNE